MRWLRSIAPTVLYLVLQLVIPTMSSIIKRDPTRHYYTLHFPQGHIDAYCEDAAKTVAHHLDAQYEGPVGELKTYFMISVHETHHAKRNQEDAILAEFTSIKERFQRLTKRDHPWSKVERIDKQVLRKRTKRQEAPVQEEKGLTLLENAQSWFGIKDPGFSRQWHLINQDIIGNDLNVTGVWKQGISGNGTVVAILDDGLDYNSEDLADNFYAKGSFDFNDHESLPKPKLWDDNHGTRCAGQIAAVRNNACGIGIAYDAKVAGIRILSGEISDVDEATALNYKFQENHIYSCSWGPTDNGQTMEAPEGILADAFKNGIENGRGGKGSVFVFATGNGALSGDNCNFDGYTNSIYTITVGAIDHGNGHPSYSESCSAQMVVAYTSGNGQYIYTTDVGKNVCTDHHGGTSAAAPNAAGVFALVLSVRPELTWRDMQHLCVQTAVPISTEDEDWKKLPSGRLYNHKFGYGKLDAYAIVEAAKTFQMVNRQTYLQLPVSMEKTPIPDMSDSRLVKPIRSTVIVTKEMVKAAGLLRLEHVTATVNIEHQRRGNIVINLVSPNDVESQLATERTADDSRDGIRNWKFMSVKHWEEDPIGNWTLLVSDVRNPEATGSFVNWTLTLFGEMDPAFHGEPVHIPDVDHDLSHASEVPHPSAAAPTTTLTEHVPARPSHIKKPTTTTTTLVSPTSAVVDVEDEEEDKTVAPEGATAGTQSKNTSKISPIVYGSIGVFSIMSISAVMFYFKQKSWRSPSLPTTQDREVGPERYEFDILEHEDEDDNDDFEETELEAGEHSDARPLLSQGRGS